MLKSIEISCLYILKYERELHMLRQDKEDVEYKMILRWLDNRIRELDILNA